MLMTNNFDTVKTASASEKFNLVRIKPARQVQDSLTLLSGTTYTTTFAFIALKEIKVDGVLFTRVSGVPSATEFSFSESTKLITINLGAALTTQKVIVFYYLFYSKEKTRITFETPTDSASTQRQWSPQISTDPTFNFNLKDITEGFLTTSNSSLTLDNEEGDFEQFLSTDDSFSKKEITMWLALDNTENVKLIYRGFVNKIKVGRKVSLEYFDEFFVLNRAFFSNGTYLKSSYNSTTFGSLHPVKENQPIHKLFAEVTTYKVIDEGTVAGLHKVDGDRLLEAHSIIFSTTISVTTNRDWGTVLNEGDGGQQSDTVSATDHTDPDFSLITHGSSKNYRIGDTLEFTGPKRARVLFVDSGADQIKTTKDATIAVSDTITRPGISVVVITQDNVKYYALFGRDYSVTYLAQTNSIIKITFTNNFEATLGMTALNPDVDVVRFRAWGDTGKSLLHGDVVKEILESSGVTVNAASITAANAASTVKTNFYIPHRNESSFKSHAANIQDILSSTLGFIFLNNDLEIGYSLFSAPSTSTQADDREILLDTFSTEIDYNDIRDSIRPQNIHDILELDFVNAGLENTKALFLHEISTQKTYDHVLADTSRMSSILGLLSERKALYKFETKIRPDTILGDQLEISRDDLIGGVSTRDITIMSLNKQAVKAQMAGFDLLGL